MKPGFGLTERTTTVPGTKLAEQLAGHTMPAGLLVTFPPYERTVTVAQWPVAALAPTNTSATKPAVRTLANRRPQQMRLARSIR
jgi:hypothetical protein